MDKKQRVVVVSPVLAQKKDGLCLVPIVFK